MKIFTMKKAIALVLMAAMVIGVFSISNAGEETLPANPGSQTIYLFYGKGALYPHS